MKKIHIIPRMKKEILYILFIAFIGLLIVLFFVPRSMMPGDRGDARFNMVILEHGYQWLIGNNTDFWGSGFFFPSEEKIIAFSDHHIGNLPIYTLFRLASFSRETSLQLLIISSLFLNFFISYIVIKRLGYSFVSSFLGAFLFSFSLPIMAQVNHMQLLPRYFSFLAIFFLYRFWNNPKLLSFIFFLLNIVLQFYQSFYLGVFTSILSVFLLIALIILDKRPLQEILKNLLGSKYSILLKFIFIFLSALLLIPIILPYYRVSQMHGTHEWETVISMLPSIRSYFSASPNSWIWNILANTDISLFWEHYLFIGSIPILLMIFSVVILIRKILVSSLTKFDILASASLLVMLFSIIIFTKFGNNFSLYFFLYKIPGVGAIRAVTRFFLVLLIFNSLVIAHSTESFSRA